MSTARNITVPFNMTSPDTVRDLRRILGEIREAQGGHVNNSSLNADFARSLARLVPSSELTRLESDINARITANMNPLEHLMYWLHQLPWYVYVPVDLAGSILGLAGVVAAFTFGPRYLDRIFPPPPPPPPPSGGGASGTGQPSAPRHVSNGSREINLAERRDHIVEAVGDGDGAGVRVIHGDFDPAPETVDAEDGHSAPVYQDNVIDWRRTGWLWTGILAALGFVAIAGAEVPVSAGFRGVALAAGF